MFSFKQKLKKNLYKEEEAKLKNQHKTMNKIQTKKFKNIFQKYIKETT